MPPEKPAEGGSRPTGIDTSTPTNTTSYEDRVAAEDAIRKAKMEADGIPTARERLEEKEEQRQDALKAVAEEQADKAKEEAKQAERESKKK